VVKGARLIEKEASDQLKRTTRVSSEFLVTLHGSDAIPTYNWYQTATKIFENSIPLLSEYSTVVDKLFSVVFEIQRGSVDHGKGATRPRKR
jgi:hypothetical protein